MEEERKRQRVEVTEMSKKTEESFHQEELRRSEEMKRLEKQRLEQMIIQGKLLCLSYNLYKFSFFLQSLK